MTVKNGFYIPSQAEIKKASVKLCKYESPAKNVFYDCVFNMKTGVFTYVRMNGSESTVILKSNEFRIYRATCKSWCLPNASPEYIRNQILERSGTK